MSTEPIYTVVETSSYGAQIHRRGERWMLGFGFGPKAVAEHICKLLNADPLPEDRPKRYAVTSYADGSCCVTDLAALPSVATFRTHHPDPLAAAQAECNRLNALDAS